MELTLLDGARFLGYLPSVIAASALAVAWHTVGLPCWVRLACVINMHVHIDKGHGNRHGSKRRRAHGRLTITVYILARIKAEIHGAQFGRLRDLCATTHQHRKPANFASAAGGHVAEHSDAVRGAPRCCPLHGRDLGRAHQRQQPEAAGCPEKVRRARVPVGVQHQARTAATCDPDGSGGHLLASAQPEMAGAYTLGPFAFNRSYGGLSPGNSVDTPARVATFSNGKRENAVYRAPSLNVTVIRTTDCRAASTVVGSSTSARCCASAWNWAAAPPVVETDSSTEGGAS